MIRYLPYGFAMGIPVAAILLWAVKLLGKGGKKESAAVLPVVLFGFYVSVMMIITFFSRESGNGSVLDLRLFSTWGINNRNNAFVIENILLFVPYGFLASWTFSRMRGIFRCGLLGAATSLGIECLQLVTGRGFFQIDDILTNTLGAIAGYLCFRLLFWKKK